jgi:hypothetical protein
MCIWYADVYAADGIVPTPANNWEAKSMVHEILGDLLSITISHPLRMFPLGLWVSLLK